MNKFSLDDFFAAFKSMRANGISGFRKNVGTERNCCQQSQVPQYYECPDAEVQYVQQDNSCPGFQCRHTPTPEPTCPPTCAPTSAPTCRPTCAPTPEPTCTCLPDPTCAPTAAPGRGCMRMPQGGFNMTKFENSGIIDGQGNDLYGMGNRGIIDTDGNDIYAKHYSINTFNTINNFFEAEPVTVAPTEAPTDAPTEAPTVDPPPPTTPSPATKVDLMPLRNLLNSLDSRPRNTQIDEDELNIAMVNPHKADLDGDSSKISAEEMAVFNKIKEFNQDKDLLSNVMKGNYDDIDEATLAELGELSDTIKELTKNRT